MELSGLTTLRDTDAATEEVGVAASQSQCLASFGRRSFLTIERRSGTGTGTVAPGPGERAGERPLDRPPWPFARCPSVERMQCDAIDVSE